MITDLFRTKARKRLKVWKFLREEKIVKETKKAAIKKKLLEKYNIPETVKEMFLSYRSKEDCYSYNDEDGNRLDLKTGDIIPFRRRGDIVFFYEITKSFRKYGDYGWSDYGYFWDLEYHHAEKTPQKVADPKKSFKIQWEKVDEKRQKMYVQGIRIGTLRVEKRESYSRQYNSVEARYVDDNFSNTRDLPNYYDHYIGVGEAKKEIQKKINKMIKDGVKIYQFYIPPKIRRKNK